ncbi:MAG: hypothetical protein QG639_71 [Patescibacteria group bacterium]|nr:hypothetical protein [Patescibacteria group bacterium]
MCGIFAYVGSETDAPQQTLEGLKKLEYRGYDSWGVAHLNSEELQVTKKTGKIGEASISAAHTSKIAIGHTRWATHGGITVENAHPHLNPDHTIAVVHNGVVENFAELKASLPDYPFKSETDTEVITALLSETLKTTEPLETALSVAQKLKGLNAFVTLFLKTNQIIAYKNGSPLIIGKSETGHYLASDNTALAGIATDVLYLEDQQLAVITGGSIELFDAKSKKLQGKWQPLTLSADMIDKQDFPHFMIKEINEQPSVVAKLSQQSFSIPAKKKIVLVGCGTAYHACVAATYFLAIHKKQSAQAFSGSEFLPWRELVDADTHVVFVSQSGETIDIVEHAQWLKNNGHHFTAVVNRKDSTLARLATKVIDLAAGPEICVLATKSFTAKLVTFLSLAGVGGTTDIPNSIAEILKPGFKDLYILPAVKVLERSPHLFILGKHEMYAMAMEAALKVKESTYLHAEAFASGELKHGVLALIEKGTPVFALIPDSAAAADVTTGAQEVKARGGYLIGVGSPNNKSDVFDHYIPVGGQGLAATIPVSVVFQLIAYYTTVALGRDPDKPRNLAKSVTVK